MKLKAFRVEGFRSIVDSRWCETSPDDVTILLGQNESGKSSILEALSSFSSRIISQDVIRSDGSQPKVSCRFYASKEEIEKLIGVLSAPTNLLSALEDNKNEISIQVSWNTDNLEQSVITTPAEWLKDVFFQRDQNQTEHSARDGQTSDTDQLSVGTAPTMAIPAATSDAPDAPSKTPSSIEPPPQLLDLDTFLERAFKAKPSFVEFEEQTGLLPNTIDVSDITSQNVRAAGYRGARNFLDIANLDVDWLDKADSRMRESKLDGANQKITKDFQKFWKQTIGSSKKIRLECNVERYDESNKEKAGKAYLIFWIAGDERLFPSQRSKGVRWFLSFYLQLKASALSKSKVIYLLDEPGGSLHAKAQEDVLRVIESIKERSQVIFSTHSPYLVQQDTTFRLLAVQRTDQEDERSPTEIFSAHRLGAASRDTLSPWYRGCKRFCVNGH